MLISFNRHSFLDALSECAAVISSRTPKEVLKHIHVAAGDGIATVSATDSETSLSVKTPVDVQKPGKVLLPPDRILRMLKESDTETVTIAADREIEFKAGRSEFNIPTADPDEFPLPREIDGNEIVLKSADLKSAIARTLFATDPDSSRYALGGVLLESDGDNLAMVGTDGRRLATVSIAGGKLEDRCLIPTKAAGLIMRSSLAETIRFRCNTNSIQVADDMMSLVARQVEGRFPNWSQVIPKTDEYSQVKFMAGPMASAIRQAAIVLDKETRGVVFRFTEGLVTIRSKTSERGSSAIDAKVEYLGSEITAQLDYSYLLDFLKTQEPDQEVVLHIKNQTSSVLLCSGDDYRYVVMPMALGK